jgi:hypothetical protein
LAKWSYFSWDIFSFSYLIFYKFPYFRILHIILAQYRRQL